MSYSLARSPLRLPGSADIYIYVYVYVYIICSCSGCWLLAADNWLPVACLLDAG